MGRSQWRNNRLLILGYHGISQHDEHDWHPSLFITPALLKSRIEFLQTAGFNILPFGEAIERLRCGDLPERSVTLTFDDGYVDFYRLAQPILRAANVPATVYLTTYYCENNLPVPSITAGYMVWRSSHFVGDIKSLPAFRVGPVDLRDPVRRRFVSQSAAQYFTDERSLTAAEKHILLKALAAELGFDLAEIQRRRLMHLMNPGEARDLAAQGIDIQLHTHRHWMPRNEALMRKEIEENRECIRSYTGRDADHFCYPGGVHYPEVRRWMRDLNVASATTCEPGIARSTDDLLTLPRFLDHTGVTQVGFESWVSGVSAVLPRRSKA